MKGANEYHTLNDIGYQSIGNAKTLARAVKKLGAVLVDVRFSPSARNPHWRKPYLEKLLGQNYRWLKEFGNEGYKSGTTKLHYPEKGVQIVEKLLETQRVILMCGCWNREKCHRVDAVKLLTDAFDILSVPLDREAIAMVAGPDPEKPVQYELFGKPGGNGRHETTT